jgi:hypothetical protein
MAQRKSQHKQEQRKKILSGIVNHFNGFKIRVNITYEVLSGYFMIFYAIRANISRKNI